MRKFTSLMLMLLCAVTTMWAGPTDLPQITTDLNNPIYYTIYNTRSSQPGGLMYYAGDNVGLKDGCTAFTLEDKCKFFFTGSHDALYVHNAATGKKLASVNSWTEDGIEWAVGVSPQGGGLAFGPKGGLEGNSCWNEKNYATGESASDFTTWSANDAGSIFVVELASEFVFPEADVYYTIEAPLFYNVKGENKGLVVDENGSLGWNTIDVTNKNCYWQIEQGDGYYAIKNVGTGMYIKDTTVDNGATEIKLRPLGGGNQFNIIANGTTMHANGHGSGNGASGNIVSYGGSVGSASAWQFVERIKVVYSFVYEGEEKYTQNTNTMVGEEYPDFSVVLPFGVSAAAKPEGVIDAADVVDNVVTNEIALSVNLPFVPANSYENITNWYYLNIRDDGPTYAYYDPAIEYIKATETSVPADKKSEYAWAFIGNPFDGYTIVNNAAEAMVLSSPNAPTGNGNADQLVRLVNETGATGNTTWNFVKPTHNNVKAENGFYIQHPTATAYAINRQGYNGANTLCYWTGRDTGSVFQVEECDMTGLADLQALIEQVEAAIAVYGKGGTTVGYYTVESASNLQAALVAAKAAAEANESAEANVTAQTNLQSAVNALATIQPEEGKFYRIISHCTKDNRANQQVYVSNDGDMHFAKVEDSKAIGHIFQFVPTTDGKFYVYNVQRGVYMEAVGSQGAKAKTTIDVTNAKPVAIRNLGVENVIGIYPNGQNMMHAQVANSKIVGWNETATNDGSAWIIEEVANITELYQEVAISEVGYATLCLGYNATIPSGVEAYAVESVDEYAQMTQITGAIPAKEAVILKLPEGTAAGTFQFTYAESAEAVETNLLEGTVFDENIASEAYVLSAPAGKAGFYKAAYNVSTDTTNDDPEVTYEAFMNNAFKAYLPIATGANLSAEFYGFNFDGTTAIEGVEVENVEKVIYDLTGRRIEKITKAGIYIVNGNKVLVK